jgi:hypothetical protein
VDFSTSASTSLTMNGNHTMTAVYVAGLPVITNQPSNLTATVGDTALFNVTALGSSLSYQWQFNGTNLP